MTGDLVAAIGDDDALQIEPGKDPTADDPGITEYSLVATRT